MAENKNKSSKDMSGKSPAGKGTGSRQPDGKSIRAANQPVKGSAKETRKGGGKKRRRKKKPGIITNIILIAAIAVFCVSAFQLYNIFKGYYDGRSEYDKLRDLALGEEKKGGEDQPRYQVNFDELLEINPDTIGWLRFDPEPAIISYPIVQGEDNQEYLHKTFSANENTLGAIFLNVDNSPSFQDENSIIYGHRMRDGSMFRHIQDYEDRAFWEANPYFYIYTLDGRELVYQVYSMGQVVDTSDTYLTEFSTEEEYQNFLNMTKEISLYDTGIEVTTRDTIVTLSTCTSASDNHRFVIRGVRVKEEENE